MTLNKVGEFYKTRMCPDITRGDRCRHRNCTYAHKKSELRQESIKTNNPKSKFTLSEEEYRRKEIEWYLKHPPTDSEEEPDTKLELCSFYASGHCKFGDSCRKSHGKEINQRFQGDDQNQDSKYFKTSICNRVNDCTFGKFCHFAHSKEELGKPILMENHVILPQNSVEKQSKDSSIAQNNRDDKFKNDGSKRGRDRSVDYAKGTVRERNDYNSKRQRYSGINDVKRPPSDRRSQKFNNERSTRKMSTSSQSQESNKLVGRLQFPSSYQHMKPDPVIKTELCHRFTKHGVCTLGNGKPCYFAHSVEELGTGVPGTEYPPEDYICKICNSSGHWIRSCPLRSDLSSNKGDSKNVQKLNHITHNVNQNINQNALQENQDSNIIHLENQIINEKECEKLFDCKGSEIFPMEVYEVQSVGSDTRQNSGSSSPVNPSPADDFLNSLSLSLLSH